LKSSLDEGAGFAALDYRYFWELRIGCRAMVTAGLLGVGGGRMEAVLTEPDGSGGSGCRGTAYAKDLEHGLATG
jgi:hypothetical protein